MSETPYANSAFLLVVREMLARDTRTHREIAKLLGKQPNNFSNIIRGANALPGKDFPEMMRALGIHEDWTRFMFVFALHAYRDNRMWGGAHHTLNSMGFAALTGAPEGSQERADLEAVYRTIEEMRARIERGHGFLAAALAITFRGNYQPEMVRVAAILEQDAEAA